MNVPAYENHRDPSVNLALKAQKTMYHQCLISRTEISRKLIPHNALDFKFSNRVQINSNKIIIKSSIAEATRKYKEVPGSLFESFSQRQEPLG